MQSHIRWVAVCILVLLILLILLGRRGIHARIINDRFAEIRQGINNLAIETFVADIHLAALERIRGLGNEFENAAVNIIGVPHIVDAIRWRNLDGEVPAITREEKKINKVAIEYKQLEAKKTTQPANKYLDLSIRHSNDSQNVHDPGVTASMRATTKRLLAEHPKKSWLSLRDIKQEISFGKYGISDISRHKLQEVLAAIVLTNIPTTIGLSDAEALQLIWTRAMAPKNLKNVNKLKQAVVDILAMECFNDNLKRPYCLQGRTEKILSALVLNDYDERNWDVKTLEQFRNDVFESAKATIRLEAQKISKSPDLEMQTIGKGFLGETTGPVNSKKEEAFKKNLKSAISKQVDLYVKSHPGVLDKKRVENVRMEAMAAIM